MENIGFQPGRVTFHTCSDGKKRCLPPTPKCKLCSNPILEKYVECWYCNIGDPIDGTNVEKVIAGSIYVPEWTDAPQHTDIQDMKKSGRYSIQYAELVLEAAANDGQPGIFRSPGYIVPVPTRWGSDNAAPLALAQALSQKTSSKTLEALQYIRATESEKNLATRQERRENVDKSMTSRYNFRDIDVCIVDDVMTTGYSICEGARALRVAGCTSRIVGLVAARNVRESELIGLGIVVKE